MTMTSLLTIVDAAAALRAKDVSSVELVTEAIAQADRYDDELKVYTARFDESALEAARAADRDLQAGRDRGPLHGIPIGIKDNTLTEEGPTTGASLVKNPLWEQCRDAPVVAKLRSAGGIVMGKTSLLEVAVGVPEASRPLTSGRNPWNTDRWAGGSSTGSASGVVSGMFMGALGTDTGGSIRLPAAFCGITGLKPTFGCVSRTDVIPLGFSLDTVGPIARSASDVALMLQAMAGHDPADPSSSQAALPDFSGELGQPIQGLRVGVDRKNHLYGEHVDGELADSFEQAVAELENLGAAISEIELPYFKQITDAVLLTVFAEGQAYHHTQLCEQWEAFGPPTRLAFASGSLLTASDYVAAQQARRIARRLTDELFDKVDVIVHPSTACAALALDGFKLELLGKIVYTHFWNSNGCPAVTTPMGFSSDGLPFGLQIAGPHFAEPKVLRVADAYQQATGWHLRLPAHLAGGERTSQEG